VITHGNGPQAGNLMVQQEMAKNVVPARADSIIGVGDVEDDYIPLVPPLFSSGLMPGSSAGEGEAWMAVGGPSDPARCMMSTIQPLHPLSHQAKNAMLCLSSGLPMRKATMATAYTTQRAQIANYKQYF